MEHSGGKYNPLIRSPLILTSVKSDSPTQKKEALTDSRLKGTKGVRIENFVGERLKVREFVI